MSFDDAYLRARIVIAATKLFQRKGYSAVGAPEIVEAAGAQPADLHKFFVKGKPGLAIACVERETEGFDQQVTPLKAAKASVADWVEAEIETLSTQLSASEYKSGPLTLALAADAALPVNVLDALAAHHSHVQAVLADWFGGEGIGKGPSAKMALATIAALEGGATLSRVQRSDAPLKAVKALLAGF